MSRQKAISILVALALAVAAVTAFVMWPKRYAVGQNLSQTLVFWNDGEVFLFLTLNSTGRSRNVLQEKLADTRYGYLTILLGGFADFSKQDVVAYHLLASGQLDRFTLPEHTSSYGSWSLINGQLQLAPPATTNNKSIGFRWDGKNFVSVLAGDTKPRLPQAAPNSNLSADDLNDNDNDEDHDFGLLTKDERQQFKDAGWHYKFLSGYTGNGAEATLPINLDQETFNLTIQSSPIAKRRSTQFDMLAFGTRSLRLSGEKLAAGSQTLWTQAGWRTVSKADYELLRSQYGRTRRQSLPGLAWLALLVFLILWRFGGWIHILFTFATMKGRVLKNMATSFSFPPATPAQFPALDLDALDRYTREFEGMGFSRLLDFSLVSDSKANPPSFCRLFAHTRHHCFGELSQIFPRGKKPLPLKSSIQSCLQNGWTLSFSDRKPQAASSLIRRRKALGICMPEANSWELLQAFLKMRDQVCLDLGVAPVNDDTLEAYIAKMQRSATEMREAVQKKSFMKGVPEVYLRKLSLVKTRPEYVWLGDYPKEAELRKQGFNTFAASVR
ncbi:MAG: hypothetical protein WBC78_23375 [Candidatus Sulfotelmatobacter sp.]